MHEEYIYVTLSADFVGYRNINTEIVSQLEATR